MSSATQKLEGGNVLIVKNETIDFANTAAGALSAGVAATVTGAKKGDAVVVQKQGAAPEVNKRYHGYVSAADTVTVYFENNTAGALDLASADYEITVISRRPL